MHLYSDTRGQRIASSLSIPLSDCVKESPNLWYLQHQILTTELNLCSS
jgi:hypothetical protein